MTALSSAVRLTHLRWMLLARTLDDRLCKVKALGEIAGSVFTGKGQEAFSAAGAMQLKLGDVFSPLIRDQAGRLVFGETPLDAARTCLGRATGPMRGRDGNIHRGNVDIGLLPMISHLGAMIALVNGMLFAKRLLGRLGDHVGMVSIGDGGMNTGATHEALNQAAVEHLPLVVMLANNQVAYSTFNDRTYACASLADRAIGYGFGRWECDGTDADQCLSTMHDAVAAARAGKGPQLIHATLLRLAGHGLHDDASYVGEDLRRRFGDCLTIAQDRLLAEGVLTAAALAEMTGAVQAEVAAAIDQARGEPQPTVFSDAPRSWSETGLITLRAPGHVTPEPVGA